MDAPKRVAAHIIRKPTVEAVCEVIENPGETSRVDVRELQKLMSKSSSVPVDLETDIEVIAEGTNVSPAAKSTRLAHTVRRADSAPIVAAIEPIATVEMPAVVVAELVATEPEPAAAAPEVPVFEAPMPTPQNRWGMIAVGALAVASVGLVVAILI